MADHVIKSDEYGRYEIPVSAGATVSFQVEKPAATDRTLVDVFLLTGNAPLYIGLNRPAVVKDSHCRMIPRPGRMRFESTTPPTVLNVTSAADCTVAVARPM